MKINFLHVVLALLFTEIILTFTSCEKKTNLEK